MPIKDTHLLQLAGVSELDFASFCESVRMEAGLTKTQIANELGISLRAYEMLTDFRKDMKERTKPSVDTFVGLLLLRAKTRNVNLKAIFL